MRLAHIKLAGFKSFVDPTVVPVSQDLVGIVGPNGCGKSNIIDAVRWVLGESKASALRGDSMQDVIFSGSDNRKAVGRASVEIVFDNHLNKITGQWSSYAEIAIKRVIQRDGNSSYYINNLPVRRRDIADLFLGTGVGGRGYAIIEQGMISRIIEAKPQELRNFLEEAAGISQYRERRHETSTRLAESRKNLTRLEDICQELGTQLQHLEVQAKIAQQYKQLQENLHHSQSLLWVLRRTEAQKQQQRAEQDIQKLEAELEIVLASQQQAEKDYEAARTKEHAVNDQLLQAQGQLYSADAEIGRLAQEINHLNSTHDRLLQQTQQVENQLQKNNQLKASKLENLAHWQQEKINIESAQQDSIQKCHGENDKLPAIEANFHACQEKLNQLRQDLLLVEQTSRLEDNQLVHAAKNIQQLEARHARLLQEQSEFVLIDPSQLTELQQQIDNTENRLEEEQVKHQEIETQLSAITQSKQHIARTIHELQQTLSQASARHTALQNLQQKLENNQSLTAWLHQRQLDTLPRLWQKISIAPEWENALEAILRERLNSIEIEQLDSILDWIDGVPQGKWTLHEKSGFADDLSSSDMHNHTGQKLLTCITVNQPEIQSVLGHWLKNVYIADDIQEGLSGRNSLSSGELLVTRQGHILTRTSINFYAPDSQLHGVLSRQQELIQIQKEIDQLEPALRMQRDLLAKSEQQFAELNNAIQTVDKNSKQLQQQRHALQLDAVKLSQASERAAHRHNQINAELTEIRQALEHEYALRESATIHLQENQQKIATLKEQTQQAQLAWETANQQLARQRQNIQQSTRIMQEAAFQAQTCQNKIMEIELNIQSLDEELQHLTQNQANLLSEMDELNVAPLTESLEAAKTQRKSIEQAALQARQAVEDTISHLRRIEEVRMASEQKSHALREAINQARLKEQAASIAIGQFDELIRDAHVDTELLLPLSTKKSVTGLHSEIEKLNAEIAALGAVNLAALEELENGRSRESSLLMQLQDLNAAIATLESAIQQIDRETELRLQDTFTQVNTFLSEIFPVIFAGGQARLEFCDDKNLDAGLLLTAQPPGKKNSSIQLLSGGEKALTALALIFSLFRLNPAPFCLLDEVDAPLDDSNTSRFCELVKTMAKQTQFLFISHNKITMEMAQRLIGVTMQEQGVSRIVAVDLAAAVQMGKREKQPAI
ncbi:MAG: chromosome segregation protein SMC [Nitrosomonas sp.]|uniref:chromosome segregation protein SMC n=1 Tax=Nitrosomonas sp. TaxID=42353 RepID=UPI0032EC79AC